MSGSGLILVPTEKISQQDRANLKADLCAKAADAINSAGNGLLAAFEQCKAGTANGITAYVLVCCSGYINDALAALIERENLGIEGATTRLAGPTAPTGRSTSG